VNTPAYIAAATLLTVGMVAVMEWVAAWSHRHIMHGWGWGWHRSHHEAHSSGLERNDLYALVFAAISVMLFAIGTYYWPVWWIACGMTLYGVLYFLVHDSLVHRRWGLRIPVPRHGYLRRIYQAHRLHHAVRGREGCVSFGFIYAKPVHEIVAELRARRADCPSAAVGRPASPPAT
jgi:beta-carotene 3-hydroxylase